MTKKFTIFTPIIIFTLIIIFPFTLPNPDPVRISLDLNQFQSSSRDGVFHFGEPFDYLGWSFTGCDFNGDGYSDFVMPNTGHNYNDTIIDSGATTVYFGSQFGFQELPSLTSLPFTLFEESFPQSWGGSSAYCKTNHSDFNGDGIDDLIVTAPFADINGISNNGVVRVLFGSTQYPDDSSHHLTNFLNGTNGFSLISNISGLAIGTNPFSSTMCDFNGDGYDDIVITSQAAKSTSFIIYGTPLTMNSSFSLENLNGTNGFKINGPDQPSNTLFGSEISCIDFNGDGFDDLFFRVPIYSPDSVFILPGRSTTFPGGELNATPSDWFTANGTILSDNTTDSNFGTSISTGDVNADGYGDLLVGAPDFSSGGLDRIGAIYLFFGSDSDSSPLFNSLTNETVIASSIANHTFYSHFENSEFGSATLLTDINNDSFDEIIIGSPGHHVSSFVNAGSISIFFGSVTLNPIINVSMGSFNGFDSYIIPGISNFQEIGRTLTHIGDMNGDGYSEFATGNPWETHAQIQDSGIFYIISGAPICQSGSKMSNNTCIWCPAPLENGTFNEAGSSSDSCNFYPLTCPPKHYLAVRNNTAYCTFCSSDHDIEDENALGSFNPISGNSFSCTFVIESKCSSHHYVVPDTLVTSFGDPFPNSICKQCPGNSLILNPDPSISTKCTPFTCPIGEKISFLKDGTLKCEIDSAFIQYFVFGIGGAVTILGIAGYARRRSEKLKLKFSYDFDETLDAFATASSSDDLTLNKGLSSSGITNSYKINVLSLDGGGVRGLILVETLRKIQKYAKIYPSLLYHFIAGTSTGGLLALALTQQKPLSVMSSLYRDLSSSVFSSSRNVALRLVKQLAGQSLYNTKKFRVMLKSIFGTDLLIADDVNNLVGSNDDVSGIEMDYLQNQNQNQMDTHFPKVLVVATLTVVSPPVEYLFRNYTTSKSRFLGNTPKDGYTFSDAACAISAAPVFFKEYILGEKIWADGALYHNNPSIVVLREVRFIYPECSFGVFTSIGTGIVSDFTNREGAASGFTWLKTLAAIATNSESVHVEISERLASDKVYFRFNTELPRTFAMDCSDENEIESLLLVSSGYLVQHEARFLLMNEALKRSWRSLSPPLPSQPFGNGIENQTPSKLVSLSVDDVSQQHNLKSILDENIQLLNEIHRYDRETRHLLTQQRQRAPSSSEQCDFVISSVGDLVDI